MEALRKGTYEILCSKQGNWFICSLNVVKHGNSNGVRVSESVDNFDDSNGKQVEIKELITSICNEFYYKVAYITKNSIEMHLPSVKKTCEIDV